MQNVLIHIGYHKTGSTWLQQELFTTANKTFEPLSTTDKGHTTLAGHFIYTESGHLLNSFDNNEEVIRKHLQQIVAQKENSLPDKYFVLSQERLSGNPNSSGFDASIIAGRLKNIFPKAKILIMIREQRSFLLSNYFQYLAMGGTHRIMKYLNTIYDGKRPGFSPGHLNYHHLIADYHNKFGKENVLILPYELFNRDKHLFFEYLEGLIDQKIDFDPKTFDKRLNTVKSHFVESKFRFLNLFAHSSSLNNYSPLRSKASYALVLVIKLIIGALTPGFLNRLVRENIGRKIDRWADGRFDQSNKRTNQLVDFDLKKFGYSIAE